MNKENLIQSLKGGLIVSCQALESEPMYAPNGGIMPKFAKAAVRAGAVGIRANGIRDILEIKAEVALPIIGIIKKEYDNSPQYITPTMAEIDKLVDAGVDIIAFDGTSRKRVNGSSTMDYIQSIKAKYPKQLLMADIATVEEARICWQAGVDFVGTTLCGYTEDTMACTSLNTPLIQQIAQIDGVRIVAEGHVHAPEQACECLACGAFCVVVGGAITRPQEIAQRFVTAISK